MNRWAYFTIGGLAGVILVLLILLVMNGGGQPAYALPMMAKDVDSHAGIVALVGGTQQSVNDLLWVIYKKAASGTTSEEKMFLTLYKASGTMTPKLKLMATREIDVDMKMVEYNNEPPSVKEINKKIKEMEDKDKDKDNK